MEQTLRTIMSQTITVAQVHTLHDHQCWEQDHEDLEPLELNSKDWPRTIELINEWLKGCLSVSTIPLAYMIHEEEEVPDQANDLPGNNTMIQEELIVRAPIRTTNGAYTSTFLTDRATVWEKLSGLTRKHDCWTYVCPVQCTQDGHLRYIGLKSHYLRVNNVDNMSTQAERKLEMANYSGEKCNWNFEKYIKLHRDQHVILKGLVEHGYGGINVGSSQVPFLMRTLEIPQKIAAQVLALNLLLSLLLSFSLKL